MRIADALLLADVQAGKQYLQASGHAWPGFDWVKQWRFQQRKAARGRFHNYFDMRIAFDDEPITTVAWKAGSFAHDEVNMECVLVAATE